MAKKITTNRAISNKMKRRLNVFVSFWLLLFTSYIVWNLVNLSVVHSAEYKKRAAEQQVDSISINSNRGTIYDANMDVLASSSTVWDVVISPATIVKDSKEATTEYKAAVAHDLSTILELDYNEVLEKVSRDNQFEYVKKKIEKPMADKVRELITDEGKQYTFISLVENTKRYYPSNTLASQVIGFTDSDNKGQYGIEGYYDNVLQGTPGKILTAIDAHGNNIPTSYEKQYNPVDGNSLVLTIDSTIQHFAESALESVVAQFNPKNGTCAIVMDVNTGAILAMANNPTFDLNEPHTLYSDLLKWKLENPEKWRYENATSFGYDKITFANDKEKSEYESNLVFEQWKNNCVTYQYMPGSVFKIITGTAALEEGVFGFNNDIYNCTGSIEVQGTHFNCHDTSGQGAQDFTQMVVNSCNPGFIHLGLLLGKEKFNRYLDAYGMTERTGIDLPAEGRGYSYSTEEMTDVDLASESFGQALTVTPIQMITSVAAAVNGGYLLQPYVVSEVIDTDGKVVEKREPNVKRQVISAEASAHMSQALEAMITQSASSVYLQGYRLGGKSGTSQINNESNSGRYVGSFLAVAPADKPEIAAIVITNEPQGGSYYGNQVAGPALRSIMENTLEYMKIDKELTDEEISNLEPIVPTIINEELEAGKTAVTNLGLEVEVVGTGTTIVDQMPKGGNSIAAGSKVIIYTQTDIKPTETPVPNIVGMTVYEAQTTLNAVGLNISLQGGAPTAGVGNVKVTTQNITEGTVLPVGSPVTVSYTREVTEEGIA